MIGRCQEHPAIPTALINTLVTLPHMALPPIPAAKHVTLPISHLQISLLHELMTK